MQFAHMQGWIKPSKANSKKPPKFAIANGFAIGSFPSQVPYSSPLCAGESRAVDITRDMNNVMKALIAPV